MKSQPFWGLSMVVSRLESLPGKGVPDSEPMGDWVTLLITTIPYDATLKSEEHPVFSSPWEFTLAF